MRLAAAAWRAVCALTVVAFVAATTKTPEALFAYGPEPSYGISNSQWSPTVSPAANLSSALSRWKRGGRTTNDYERYRKPAEPSASAPARGALSAFNQERVPLIRLTRDVLAPQRYDVRARPVADHRRPLRIHVSMSLYQIIDVNEPSQNIKMNVWMIQKWRDESLNWDPRDYAMINTTILPHSVLWVPDTYVYNSVVMSADETERYMNIRADSLFWEGRRGANMSFLYPALYTVTCRLNIRYFPYDQQNCTLTIGSWTNSKSAVDYEADDRVNMASFIPNEEWEVMSFRIFRHEYKYACCPEPWVILEASIILRRKPLYYVINLIIPTSIITLVAITGFFTPASTSDDRTEKINLGITTLLAMSILMLMVSDAMPTTSEFVPLIAWFYLSIIIIISIGTFLTSVLLGVQSRRQYGELPPACVRRWILWRIREMLCMRVPPQLALIWDELDDHPIDAKDKPPNPQPTDVSRQQQNGKCVQGAPRPKSVELVDENAVTLCGDSARVLPPVARRIRSAQIRQNAQQARHSTDGDVRWRAGRRTSRRRSDAARVRLNWQRVIRSVVEQRRLEAIRNDGSPDDSAMESLPVPMIDTATPPCASPPLPPPPSSLATAHLLTPTLTEASFFEGPTVKDASVSSPPLTAPPLPPRRTSYRAAGSRRPSSSATIRPRSRQDSTWDMTMTALGVTSHRKSIGSMHTAGGAVPIDAPTATLPLCALSPEVAEMRRRRQCSLEWEFVATILDRVFLILFTFTVLSVTAALMVTGRVAQAYYESG